MAHILTKKPKIAIFDLTDCEGCELEFINLREKLAKINQQVEIVNWRLACDIRNLGPFDITFIEGSPITPTDIEVVKQARAVSRTVIALGTCATHGGLQASLSDAHWKSGIKEVYGKEYKTPNKPPRPISYYIQVDAEIAGCPINTNELESFLASLLVGKLPKAVNHPVCLECKARENNCLLLEGQPCLGPVTKGGCEAVCPSRGLRCWGCFGALKGGNQKALKDYFVDKFGDKRTKQIFQIFYSQQNEFKEIYPTKFEENIKKKTIRVKVT